MKTAIDKVRARVDSLDDHSLIEKLCANEELEPGERAAFYNMRSFLFDCVGEPVTSVYLSGKQRRWAREVLARVMPISADDVPRGKEVPDPPALRNRPLKPPPPRKSEE